MKGQSYRVEEFDASRAANVIQLTEAHYDGFECSGVQNSVRRSKRSNWLYARFRRRICRLFVLMLVIGSAFVIILSSNNTVQADEDANAIKQYMSITIQPGDTLWGIASEYMDGHYSCTQEYIDELMFINNLSSDTINAGAHLVVTYYVG